MNKRALLRILVLIALVQLILFTLSACTNTRYVEKPVFVDVPVTEPCIKAVPEEPVYETKHLQSDDPIGVVGRAYRIERKQRETYINTLKAEMTGCIEYGKTQ